MNPVLRVHVRDAREELVHVDLDQLVRQTEGGGGYGWFLRRRRSNGGPATTLIRRRQPRYSEQPSEVMVQVLKHKEDIVQTAVLLVRALRLDDLDQLHDVFMAQRLQGTNFSNRKD